MSNIFENENGVKLETLVLFSKPQNKEEREDPNAKDKTLF